MHPSAAPAARRPVARHALWALGGTLLFGALLGLVAGGWGPLARLDQNWAGALHGYARRHTAWTASMQTLGDIDGPVTMRVLLFGAAAWLWAIRARTLASWAAVQGALGWVLAIALADAVGRERPHFADPVSHADGAAFPSGHAMASGITCAVLVALAWPLAGRAGRIWAAGAAAVAVLAVGWSRIALGVHWPSDVLAGWLAAAALLGWATVAVELWRPGALARDFRRVDRRTRPRVQRVLARGTPPGDEDEEGDADGGVEGPAPRGRRGRPGRSAGRTGNGPDDGDGGDGEDSDDDGDDRPVPDDADDPNELEDADDLDDPCGYDAADEAPVHRRHS
ncbi:phosphatase PAP2 family protein [Kitasatospora sp. DSM 101779]|uniref:phosphatase PAP2 family protein n=1 Tax=Kitasatospora sp. DSM 101779 TaxID=2853165 RepID=UPI0021DAD53C|nr:phosphatase PAP2 family protein [Kitasatospora sp. DSM 101779]MCU7823218.1 phosphatase PAP2 family protein [Kitasatospora sp. DSM 101779]